MASSDGLCNKSLRGKQALWDAHCAPDGCACRRGSSVALMLDVRSLGAVEPICSVNTPREVTIHFLRTAGHPLTRWDLQHQPPSPKQLEEEFLVRSWDPLHITSPFYIKPSWISWASLLLAVLEEELQGCPHPCSEDGRGEKEAGKGDQMLTHLLLSPPTARRSPQTLSTLKTWISLVMPPRTDTRPSCQVRTAVEVKGAGFLGMENLRRQDILYALKPGMVVHTCNNPSTWRCKQRTRNSRPVSNR